MTQFINVVLILISTCVGLLIPEVLYRFRQPSVPQFMMAPTSSYSQLDPEFGYKFPANMKMSLSFIKDGKVAGCIDEVASANSDGLGGRDTITDFERADIRLFMTGDSFTHWKQGGKTIPDAVSENMRAQRHLSVANLNFGRGAQGLIHMVKIAAGRGLPLDPSAIVIQFISDDLTRAWWFSKEHVDEDGQSRAFLARSLNDLENPSRRIDEYLVDARATYDWCQTQLTTGSSDEVLESSIKFFKKLEDERTFLLRPLFYANLYYRLTGRHIFDQPSLPRIQSARELREYVQYSSSVSLLRRGKTPIILIHIPDEHEIRTGVHLNSLQSEILSAIEKDLGVKTIFISNYLTRAQEFQWNLAPLDAHPSLGAINEYGRVIAMVIMQMIPN
jgi:hypothetical protein